jgi:uncharacterized protein (TIGR00369 family)
VLNEPVRGSIPDPSFFSLSGLDQLRSFMRGLMPSTPLFRLLGPRVTQASSGTVVLNQPISPWFEAYEGFVDLTATAEYSVFVTALTGAPPATHLRIVNLSVRYLRPCTVENETVIARGRILHAGSSFTTVETLIEDALGRAVAHATGSVVISPMVPAPPPLSRPLEPAEDPTYSTPDPYRRPGPVRDTAPPNADRKALPPFGQFLGAQLLEVTRGRGTVTMPTSEWLCRNYREVVPGILATIGDVAVEAAIATVAEADERMVVIDVTSSFLAPVDPADGPLVAVGSVRGRRNDVLVMDIEVADAEKRTVMIGQGTGLLLPRGNRSRQAAPDRVLLSVLFTDLVDSTARARDLGDTRWRELLAEHHALVRRQLELHKGREVKTTGDGFLATFDSPTRAVACARAIRLGLTRLDLEIRAGIHTGECELVGGDVAGVAVHVASRIQSAAQPGEILVSSTVRDLIAGSGLQLAEREAQALRGLDGKWVLLAVED